MTAKTFHTAAKNTKNAVLAFFACLLFLLPAGAFARNHSELVVPSFTVDLDGGKTSLFSVVNTAPSAAYIRITVYSNWGVEVLSTWHELAPHASRSYNLADWLVQGKLPDRLLSAEDLADAQAALSGREVPSDQLNYGTEKGLRMAHGSLVITSTQEFTFGDFFSFDPAGNNAEGDQFFDMTQQTECGTGLTCERHALRFFTGGPLNTDTEIVIRAGRKGQPSASPYFPENEKITTTLSIYAMNGDLVETRELDCLPLDVLKVSELGLSVNSGWIDVSTSESTLIAVRYTADERFSVGLRPICLPTIQTTPPSDPPEDGGSGTPAIDIEKATNGEDADEAPGPEILQGDAVTWTYVVTNTGETELSNVTVTDDQGVAVSCPASTLAAGASMTCTGNGTATLGQYKNIGSVTATSPEGDQVSDEDASHYNGTEGPDDGSESHPSIDVEKATNGQDADSAPGVQLNESDAVTWTYVVTNTGDTDLEHVSVTDDQGVVVTCPTSFLVAGQAMTCTGHGTAIAGQYKNVGTATAVTPDGSQISDSDPSHYYGEPENVEEPKDDRFMTGGAFIEDTPYGKFDVQITKLNCDGSKPNNMNVEWGGQGNQRQMFMMKDLLSVTCSDTPGVDPGAPAANFDTAEGYGTGKIRGKDATITFKFIDAGEPGTGDSFDVTITTADETIHVAGTIDGGNYQAHK